MSSATYFCATPKKNLSNLCDIAPMAYALNSKKT